MPPLLPGGAVTDVKVCERANDCGNYLRRPGWTVHTTTKAMTSEDLIVTGAQSQQRPRCTCILYVEELNVYQLFDANCGVLPACVLRSLRHPEPDGRGPAPIKAFSTS